MYRIGEQYYREEPTLAGRFRKSITTVLVLKSFSLYAVRPLGRTGCLERKRKANTIGLTIIAMSGLRNRGLSPVPGLSFVNIIFVGSEEWRLAPPFRVGNMTMVVNSALAFVGN